MRVIYTCPGISSTGKKYINLHNYVHPIVPVFQNPLSQFQHDGDAC